MQNSQRIPNGLYSQHFRPPYCPNPSCAEHHSFVRKGMDPSSTTDTEIKFHRVGTIKRVNHPSRVQRYRCLRCRRAFSDSTFHLNYYDKRAGLSPHIFNLFTSGLTNRQIARNLSCSPHLVRIRLLKMSRFALIEHSRKLRSIKIAEPVAYDGLENFAHSQYDPNNINQVLGSKSLFIYDFAFAPMNRKGRTSPRQKLRKSEIESLSGRYPKDAIRSSTADVFRRIADRWNFKYSPSVQILSDEHFQYRHAFKRDLAHYLIDHATISAKRTRLYKHILFPVNHADMLIRLQIRAFARETVAFSKTALAMIHKYALFMTWKNFMRPQFIKPHKRDPLANRQSPAQYIGLETKILSFFEFFDIRYLPSQVPISPEWRLFLQGGVPFPRTL